MIMRWLLSFLVLAIVAVVRAASFTGNRLLVVVEEQAEREKYSVFLEDLAGRYIPLGSHKARALHCAINARRRSRSDIQFCCDWTSSSRVSLQVVLRAAWLKLPTIVNSDGR